MSQFKRRVGKSVCSIDFQRRRGHLIRLWNSVSIHFAARRLGCVGGNASHSMTRLPRHFRRNERIGHKGGVHRVRIATL